MTKITIEIDTSLDGVTPSDPNRVKLAANKIGLLSTIALGPLSNVFWTSANQSAEENLDLGYTYGNLHNGKHHLKSIKGCKVIATAGGMPAFTAVNTDNDIPFISLVGMVPPSLNTQCFGGVSLESYKSSVRRNYLLGLPGQDPVKIYLLTNSNSPVFHQAETGDWTGPVGTLQVSYGGRNNVNDATKLSWDWVGGEGNPALIPDDATGVIISDDPFFQANQSYFMTRVSNWLAANANRVIVFPNSNYSTSGLPANQAVVKGCNLPTAYTTFGGLAYNVSRNPNVNYGFTKLVWS